MVAVINVDPYSFLAFSDLTCHFEDTWIDVFLLKYVPDSKETKIVSLLQQQVQIPA